MYYVEEFIKDCQIRGLTKQTISTYKCNISDFLAATHGNPAEITQRDLRDHLMILQQRRYKPSTYNSYYAALNTFYDFLMYEKVVIENPIPAFRKRYLSHIMKTSQGETRQNISVPDMRQLIKQTDEIEIKIIPVAFAKTGLRRGEFLDIIEKDTNLDKEQIFIRNKPKRCRNIVYMDDELHALIDEYLSWRSPRSNSKWLWTSQRGGRIHKDHAGKVIGGLAEPLGLHNPSGPLNERLIPHCFRHFLTTELFKEGMDPQYIKWIRGDSLKKEAWQIYNHIDPDMVRAEYERCIPKLL